MLLNEFAIQLYSLREETARDFAGAVDRMAPLGYSGVEFAGYGGLSADEMKALLERNKLKSVSSHVGLDRLENNLNEELAYNKTLGSAYIVLPGAPMETLADVEALAQKLIPIAEKVRAAGFGFGYHNHAHEFATDGGTYLLDALALLVPAQLMTLELDIYWAAVADVAVEPYMEKHTGRIELVHVKQMAADKHCVDLDDGVLDYARLIPLGQRIGVKHFILEQEEFAVSPWVSLEKNIKYIHSL